MYDSSRHMACSQLDFGTPCDKEALSRHFTVRHSLLLGNHTEHRRGRCVSPLPFTMCLVGIYQLQQLSPASTQAVVVCYTSKFTCTLPLPEYLPAPLPHTRLAPSPAFLVLAAKSMDMLHWLLYLTRLCAVKLGGNLGWTYRRQLW